MGVAIKRNVQVVCCDETQADAADDFAFDQGEPTVVKGRTLPIKVRNNVRHAFVMTRFWLSRVTVNSCFACGGIPKVFRVLSLIEADSASDTSKRSHLVGRQGEVDFIWHIVTSAFLKSWFLVGLFANALCADHVRLSLCRACPW